jgi:MFS family permease
MSRPRLFTPAFLAVLGTQASVGYASAAFFLLPKFLTTELHLGPAEIGLLTGLFSVVVVVLMPFVGSWVDRFGRLSFLRAGIVLQALTSVAFIWVDESGPLLYGLRIMLGVAWALAYSGAGAIVTDHAPPERLGEAIGMFGLASLIMNGIAPTATELIAASYGWDPAFALTALACAIAFGVTLLLEESQPEIARNAPQTGLLDLLTRRRTLWWLAIIAAIGCAFNVMQVFSQPFALELGIDEVRDFFIGYAIAAGIARLGLGRLADRVGRRPVALVAMGIYTFAMLAMLWLGPGRLLLLGCIWGLAHGLFYPAFNAIALEGAGVGERGKIMAVFNAAFHAGSSLSLVFGVLAAHAGFPAVFVCTSGVVLAGTALLAAGGRSAVRTSHAPHTDSGAAASSA